MMQCPRSYRDEKEGITERVDSSPWVSPTVMVQIGSGYPDLREPNKVVVVDSHPLPHIEEVFRELQGYSVQCYLDDIILIKYSDTPTLHEARLKAVLHRLNNSGLKVNV